MTQYSRKKIIAQKSSTDLTSTNSRITNLENANYKITYYEIISGASGSLTLPTGATINPGEFGLSGNCVLSKIDGSNKPTFESPKTSGGTIVTASLDENTGAWVASGTYTDTDVALIYSIKIKAINYSNLTYDRIIETLALSDISGTGYVELAPVISQINTPVGSPTIGDRYLVGTVPTGVFVGNANSIAVWGGASYTYTVPVTNNVVFITNTLTTLRFNGTSWVAYNGTAILQNGNKLGASVNIGTNDNFDVNFKRNNITQWTINSSGWLVRATGTKIVSLNDGFISITDPATNATPGLQLTQTTTLNRFAQFLRAGSTGAGVFTGTSIASNDMLLISNGGTSSDPYPVFTRGSILYNITGHTGTNIGTRLDSVGFRIGAISTLHTTNTAKFEITAGSATVAPFKLNSGTNLTTPVNGVMEYNGTNLFFTRAGAVREGVLTQSAITTEVLVSDTSVTVNIGGVTYKLLAKA